MTYIQSWADNPNLQQGFQGFLQNLLAGVAPDHTARQRFQQLVLNDPTLIERISNMDEGARETFSKTVLGAKNKNPLEKIGTGSVKAERDRIAKARANATPQQQLFSDAADIGVPTQADIDYQATTRQRAGITFETGQEAAKQEQVIRGQSIDQNKAKLDEMQTEKKRIDKAVAAYPNLQGVDIHSVASEAVFGRGNQALIVAINQDKYGAKLLFDAAIKLKEDEILYGHQTGLKLATDRKSDRRIDIQLQNDETQALKNGWAQTDLELKQADTNLKSAMANIYTAPNDPRTITALKPLQDERDRLAKRVSDYSLAYEKRMMDLGMMPQQEIAPPPPPPSSSQSGRSIPQVDEKPPEDRAPIIAQRIEQGIMTLDQALSDTRVSAATKSWLQRRYKNPEGKNFNPGVQLDSGSAQLPDITETTPTPAVYIPNSYPLPTERYTVPSAASVPPPVGRTSSVNFDSKLFSPFSFNSGIRAFEGTSDTTQTYMNRWGIERTNFKALKRDPNRVSNDVAHLHADVKGPMIELQRMMNEAGLPVKIGQTLRSSEKQAEYYAQGRDGDKRPQITWTLNSGHESGSAVDFIPLGDAKASERVLAAFAARLGLKTIGPGDPFHVEAGPKMIEARKSKSLGKTPNPLKRK